MKRRDYLKNIGLGSLGMAVMSPQARATELLDDPYQPQEPPKVGELKIPGGRTKAEAIRDAKLANEKFLDDHELKTITVLSDIIIPADARSGSASQAGVPAFIAFMAVDQPTFQTPLRGGIKWLDRFANRRFEKNFVLCSSKQQIEIVEEIAYPEKSKPDTSQGISFFSLMRNLTATGFFSSQMGIKDIGYQGNVPNNWEGVPADVLKQHGVSYE